MSKPKQNDWLLILYDSMLAIRLTNAATEVEASINTEALTSRTWLRSSSGSLLFNFVFLAFLVFSYKWEPTCGLQSDIKIGQVN